MATASEKDKFDQTIEFIKKEFYGTYLEGLRESIRIPSLNPDYDPDWLKNQALFK